MAIASIMLILIFVLYGGMFLFLIADYVLSSLGLYGIAKKRDISLAGLAWLPVGNLWVLGSVIDSYEEKKEDHFKKWRILLPVLVAVIVVGYILFYIVYFMMYFAMFGTMIVETNMEELPDESIGLVLIFFVVFFVLVAALALVMTAVQTLNYVAIYKTFENIAPKKALKYFILSVTLPLAEGICMLKCKKQMPERTPFDDVSKDAPVNDYQFAEPVQITQSGNASGDVNTDELV